jgi:hypothetical protein
MGGKKIGSKTYQFTEQEAHQGYAMRGGTKVYCCYGMYADMGHSDDCKQRREGSAVRVAHSLKTEALHEASAVGSSDRHPPTVSLVMADKDAEREAFEAWCVTQGWIEKPKARPNGTYVNGSLQARWLGWWARACRDTDGVIPSDGGQQ